MRRLLVLSAVGLLISTAGLGAAGKATDPRPFDLVCQVLTTGPDLVMTEPASNRVPNDVPIGKGVAEQGVLVTYFGSKEPFDQARFDVGTAGQNGITRWAYAAGGFEWPYVPGTGNGFSISGTGWLTVETPMDTRGPDAWIARLPPQPGCGTEEFYFLRATTHVSYTLPPVLNRALAV